VASLRGRSSRCGRATLRVATLIEAGRDRRAWVAARLWRWSGAIGASAGWPEDQMEQVEQLCRASRTSRGRNNRGGSQVRWAGDRLGSHPEFSGSEPPGWRDRREGSGNRKISGVSSGSRAERSTAG